MHKIHISVIGVTFKTIDIHKTHLSKNISKINSTEFQPIMYIWAPIANPFAIPLDTGKTLMRSYRQ